MTTRILITGSRDWRDRYTIYRALNAYVTEVGLWYPPDQYGNTLPTSNVVVVHGGARGADTIAGNWAISNHLTPEVHEPDYTAWPPQIAPQKRNEHMVALGADICLAFVLPCGLLRCRRPKPHDSHGAGRCADLAEKAGIPVRRYTT